MKKNSLFAILIVILAAALRLITLPNLLSFTPDETYQAYITQTLIKDFHIIWIGLSAGGFNLYLGPFWNYIIYPFLYISKGDPLSLGVATSFLGIATTFLVYWTGKKMFNEKAGIIASLLYACLPLIIYYDQKPYPSGMSFLTILIALSLYMTKFSGKWWILFAAAYGMVFHIHLSLILLIVPAIYWAFHNRKRFTKKVILLSALTFILMVSPLIAFDYFHKGSNITTPVRILNSSKEGKVKPKTEYHLNNLFLTFGRLWHLDPYKNNADEILYPCSKSSLSTISKPHIFFSFLTFFVLLTFIFSKQAWIDTRKRLLILLSLSFIAPFTFLSIINPVEYYLVGFFPLFFLITASLVESLNSKFKLLAYLLITGILVAGLLTILTARGDFGLNTKKKLLIQVMDKIGNNEYVLEEEGDCHKYEGWRYVFSVYGRRPERSSEDKTFAWLYPDEVSNKEARYKVIIKETRAPQGIDQSSKFVLTEGGFTAYIFEEKSN